MCVDERYNRTGKYDGERERSVALQLFVLKKRATIKCF